MTDRKSPLVAMSVYAKEHRISYQEVSKMLADGKLTYEDIGAENPVKVAAESEPIFQAEKMHTECQFCGKKISRPRVGKKYCSLDCTEKAKAELAKRRAERRKERREQIFTMRDDGLTTSEIARKVGCSPSWVSETLRRGRNYVHEKTKYFMPPVGCIYTPLKEWMIANRIGYRDLFEQSNLWSDVGAIRRRLQGESRLDKEDIDEILRITSKTYEQLFLEKG